MARMSLLSSTFLLALVPQVLAANNVTSGLAYTSTYWDCCKPSCSWMGKADVLTNGVQTCDIKENPLGDFTAGTGCGDSGTAFACNTQQPWAVNDTFSYGFVSGFIVGGAESDWCCSCYEIEFTTGDVKGKKMHVQGSNTGYDDPNNNRFGIGVPGGYDYSSGCAKQYGGTFGGLLGEANKNGVTKQDQCDNLPEPLRAGCNWRFDWYMDAQYPNMTFKRIVCPEILTNKTNCIRKDEGSYAGVLAGAGQSSASTYGVSALASVLTFALFAFGI